ncbi:MAG TPA: DNA gyrase C-terminal beta-propeller domain-containing protein, partial [Pseudogracilibacillus sp.]|nr:DNA gyrase C-terminal beta-propeller domain-containing protein [Pseudogracilibacillus sp.]
HGMIKKSTLDLYDSPRYTRSMIALNLRKNDELISVNQSDGTNHIFMSSGSGNGLLVDEQEISPVGQRALGVIGMQLKDDEKMVSGSVFNQNLTKEVAIITQRGACKRMKLDLFEVSPRARRGLMMLRELKARPHLIKGAFIINPEDTLGFNTTRDVQKIFSPYEFPLSERISNGSFIIDADIDGEVNQTWKEASYSKPFPDKE